MDVGRTIKDGPAHKIKACGARHCSACTTRLQEGILKIEKDLFEYIRYRIPCKYLPCGQIDLDLTDL
jgi:ferredoxin